MNVWIVFSILTLVVLISAAGTLGVRQIQRSHLWMTVSGLGVASLYLLFHFEFLAFAQAFFTLAYFFVSHSQGMNLGLSNLWVKWRPRRAIVVCAVCGGFVLIMAGLLLLGISDELPKIPDHAGLSALGGILIDENYPTLFALGMFSLLSLAGLGVISRSHQRGRSP